MVSTSTWSSSSISSVESSVDSVILYHESLEDGFGNCVSMVIYFHIDYNLPGHHLSTYFVERFGASVILCHESLEDGFCSCFSMLIIMSH